MTQFKLLVWIVLGMQMVYAKIEVIVSIAPQKTFVEKIGGAYVHVTTMVKPGSDPHTYEPKPSQMFALSQAQLYFPIKIEFEKAWLPKFTTQNSGLEFVEMTKNVPFMQMSQSSHDSSMRMRYEWMGEFSLSKGTYEWCFDQVDGRYADATMKFLMLKGEGDTSKLMKVYREKAERLFRTSKVNLLESNAEISERGEVYTLQFDPDEVRSCYGIKVDKEGNYLLFTEHMPFEFGNNAHYLKNRASEYIEPMRSEPTVHGHHHHHHGVDPHTWLSPSNVKIMAKNIYEALVEYDPQHKAYFLERYLAFLKEIDATDSKIKNVLVHVPKGSKFMVFHPSWGYFAKAYQLEQLSIEVEGKEPKPSRMREIIETAKKEQIKIIFAQKEFSDKSAKAIANELKIKVFKETPLAENWSENLIKMAGEIAASH